MSFEEINPSLKSIPNAWGSPPCESWGKVIFVYNLTLTLQWHCFLNSNLWCNSHNRANVPLLPRLALKGKSKNNEKRKILHEYSKIPWSPIMKEPKKGLLLLKVHRVSLTDKIDNQLVKNYGSKMTIRS